MTSSTRGRDAPAPMCRAKSVITGDRQRGGAVSAAQLTKGKIMSRKICGFQSRKVAAFLAGLVTGVLIGGCSVFGPGIGASVY